MGHFSSPIDYCNFNLVSSFQKLAGLLEFDVEVVGADLQPDANLLDLDRFSPAAAFILLFGALVVVFTPVDDFGDRRIGLRRNLDQVEPGGLSQLQRFGQSNYAALLTELINNPQFSCPNVLINPGRLSDRERSSFNPMISD